MTVIGLDKFLLWLFYYIVDTLRSLIPWWHGFKRYYEKWMEMS